MDESVCVMSVAVDASLNSASRVCSASSMRSIHSLRFRSLFWFCSRTKSLSTRSVRVSAVGGVQF